MVSLPGGCESHFADPLCKLCGGCPEVRGALQALSAGTDRTDRCVTFAGTSGTPPAAEPGSGQAGPAGTTPAAHSACAPGRAGPAIPASPGGCETFFSFQPSGRSRVLAGGGCGTGVLLHFEDGEKRPEFSEPVSGARRLQSPRRPGEASPGEGAPAGRRYGLAWPAPRPWATIQSETRNPAPRPEVASCNINYRRNACLGPPNVFIATESRSLFV